MMTALTGIGDNGNAKCVVLKEDGSNWTHGGSKGRGGVRGRKRPLAHGARSLR